jgi:soluble lytic murein transglycosylase-like protein
MAAAAGAALVIAGGWLVTQVTAGHAIERLGLGSSIGTTPAAAAPATTTAGGSYTPPASGSAPAASVSFNDPNSGKLDTNPWPTAPPASTYPGNLNQWVSQAVSILNSTGTPANADDINTIIKFESGGNPVAVNDYDINAKNGHPSIGLMQTIRSTFNAHALPGHYDIFNPVDNIIAAVRYAQAVYGGLSQVPGIISVHNGGPYVPY